MKISARNILKGKVVRIINGPVNTEVTVRVSGGEEVVSIITRASAEELQLSEGKEVYAVIKASHVLIATD